MDNRPETGWLARLSDPKWRFVRIPIGIFLILGGLLGFLPILGFWMLPLGLALLAIDFPGAGRLLAALRNGLDRLTRKKRG